MVHPILEELNVDVILHTRGGQTFLLAGQISITWAALFTKFDYISAEQTFLTIQTLFLVLFLNVNGGKFSLFNIYQND
jgi:hypothetical protein